MSETADQTTAEIVDRGDDFTPEAEEGAGQDFSAEDLDTLINEFEQPKTGKDKEAEDGGHEMPTSIPIGRFKEVNDKYKATAEENARLQAELEAARRMPSVEDLKAKEQQYIELMNDGEWDRAADVRLEINAAIMKSATIQAERNSESKAQMKAAEEASDRIWNENPWLHGNEEAQEDFRTWRVIGENKGLSKAKALEFAAKKVKPIYAGVGAVSESTQQAADKRQEEALLRGMKDAKKQPPPLAGTGARGQESQNRNYTDDDLSGMSKDEKARLRGDFV